MTLTTNRSISVFLLIAVVVALAIPSAIAGEGDNFSTCQNRTIKTTKSIYSSTNGKYLGYVRVFRCSDGYFANTVYKDGGADLTSVTIERDWGGKRLFWSAHAAKYQSYTKQAGRYRNSSYSVMGHIRTKNYGRGATYIYFVGD